MSTECKVLTSKTFLLHNSASGVSWSVDQTDFCTCLLEISIRGHSCMDFKPVCKRKWSFWHLNKCLNLSTKAVWCLAMNYGIGTRTNPQGFNYLGRRCGMGKPWRFGTRRKRRRGISLNSVLCSQLPFTICCNFPADSHLANIFLHKNSQRSLQRWQEWGITWCFGTW